ncbi:hypothetical protein YC2023_040793 [Brassica napus]
MRREDIDSVIDSLADLNDLVLEILHEGAIRHEFPSLLQGTSSYADSSCLEIQKETARGVNSITQKKQQSNNNKRRISSTKRRSTSALKISQSYASIMSCHYSTLAIGSNYMGSTVLVMAHIKPTSLLRLRLFFSITIELYIGEEDGLHQRDRKLVTSSYWVVSLPVKDSAWKHSFDTPVYRELKSFIDSIEN